MSDVVVVKIGGTTLAEQQQVLGEVAQVARTRPIVLVHGGGKRISEWLERLGVQSRFVNGLRVTDPAALEVAAAVLRGVVNSELVAALRDAGCDAVGLSGVDGGLLIGHRLPDVGLVATVTGVRRDLLDQLMVGGQVPVVAPLARDEEGVVCNVNADDAAAGLAAGLGARQLVLMTDVDGVRGDGRPPSSDHRPRRGRRPDRVGHHPRRHGAQGPGGTVGPLLGRRRGHHRRRVRTRRAGPRPDGPDLRDPGGCHGPRCHGPGRRGVSGQHAVTVKRDRHAAIRRVVTAHPIGSQGELVAELSALGFEVTQATVSRDIAELGLAKVMRGGRSIYVVPEAIGAPRPQSDERLRRILADIPVTVARSGLILVLVGQPGTASVIAQAIDESTLSEQVGTVAGDNTLIVLFADEPALLGWLERFDAINAPAEPVAAAMEALSR